MTSVKVLDDGLTAWNILFLSELPVSCGLRFWLRVLRQVRGARHRYAVVQPASQPCGGRHLQLHRLYRHALCGWPHLRHRSLVHRSCFSWYDFIIYVICFSKCKITKFLMQITITKKIQKIWNLDVCLKFLCHRFSSRHRFQVKINRCL